MSHNLNTLLEAKRQIESMISKLTKSLESLESKANQTRYKSQITLSKHRIDALKVALELMDIEIDRVNLL